ncbi:MAG: hypothetical protein IRZ11_05960 [Clostridia bacterium]|nr:hypothetical protein [Clostridia bacterium]
MDVAVTVEMTPVMLHCVLLAPAGLPFSTFLFDEFESASVEDPLPGVRVADDLDDPAFMMEVLFLPPDASEDEAARAFAELVADSGRSVEEGVPSRAWAVRSATVDHGATADVFFLGRHGATAFIIHEAFRWSTVEQFGGVLDAFLKEWRWNDDGTYLIPQSG